VVSFHIFENDAFVRGDVIDILQDYFGDFTDLTITVSESLTRLADELRASAGNRVALLSGTKIQISEFFSFYTPSPDIAYVILEDGEKNLLQGADSISYVHRPFTNESLTAGIRSALSYLHSCH
tara:strand:- start:62 stop:433 length:372 start_codon:yes stop_codon:yes gene_type:complete